jgi:hypothetical protein
MFIHQLKNLLQRLPLVSLKKSARYGGFSCNISGFVHLIRLVETNYSKKGSLGGLLASISNSNWRSTWRYFDVACFEWSQRRGSTSYWELFAKLKIISDSSIVCFSLGFVHSSRFLNIHNPDDLFFP